MGSEEQRRDLSKRADAIIEALVREPRTPDHIRSPAFAGALLAWGRAEAMAAMAWDIARERGPDAFTAPDGQQRCLAEVWRAHAKHANWLRERLGLSPAAYAEIASDVRTGEALARGQGATGWRENAAACLLKLDTAEKVERGSLGRLCQALRDGLRPVILIVRLLMRTAGNVQDLNW